MSIVKREFCRGYVKKHSSAPAFKEDNHDTRMLTQKINSQGYEAMLDYEELRLWENITPFNCLQSKVYKESTMNLKDTACTKFDYDANNNNSIKEIDEYLMRDSLEVPDLRDLIKNYKPQMKRKAVVTNSPDRLNDTIKTWSESSHKGKVTRLVDKEKEQKPEGRFFGIAEYTVKLSLSKLMADVKHVLSYYKDQIMTLNDMERKELLYESAQELNDKQTYSLLLDISGHNQSMSIDNCQELLEFIMGLFGIEGYGETYRLFRDQIVVQENRETGHYYASTGQYGAIEGWMNQLWGLQSAMIMRLFAEEYKLDIIQILTYSDDINTIFRVNDQTKPDDIFLLSQREYMKFGQLTKIKQTQLSATRCTMLKQHYMNGKHMPTTLKKLLSISMFTSTSYYSDQIEIDAISASTSSAMDNCNDIMSVLYFKHFYALLCSYHNYAVDLGRKELSKDLLSALPIQLKNHLDSLKVIQPIRVSDLFKDKVVHYVTLDKIRYRIKRMNNELLIQQNNERFRPITPDNPVAMKIINAVAEVENRIQERSNILETITRLMNTNNGINTLNLLWLLRLYSPQNIGGLGLMTLEEQSISGHSDMRAKWLEFSLKLIYRFVDQKEVSFWVKFILKTYNPELNGNPEELIAYRYPPNETCMTYKDYIKASIIETLNSKSFVNTMIKSYMGAYKDKHKVTEFITFLWKKRFSYRITRKYLDLSHVELIGTFLSKFNNSNTIIKYASDRRLLIQKIFRSTTNSAFFFMQYEDYKFPNNLIGSCPEMILNELRALAFKDFVFVDPPEPTYDHFLKRHPIGNLVSTTLLRNMMMDEKGMKKYHKPLYNKAIKPKYQTRYEEISIMPNPVEHRIFELVKYTKWLIHSSELNNNTGEHFDDKMNTATTTCNELLSYYTIQRYKDIEMYCMVPSGGEIFHRTDNRGFKAAAALRIFPSDSGSVQMSTGKAFSILTSGDDSNINYDYMRCKLVMKHLLYNKYYEKGLLVINYHTGPSESIMAMDVRRNYILRTRDYESPIRSDYAIDITRLGQRISTVSQLLSEGYDYDEINTKMINTSFTLESNNTEGILSHIMKLLSNQLNSKYLCGLEDINNLMWERLYELCRNTDLYTEDKEKGIDMLKELITKRLNRGLSTLYVYKGDISQAITNRLRSLIDEDISTFEAYIKNRTLLELVAQKKKFVQRYCQLLIEYDYLSYNIVKVDDKRYIINTNFTETQEIMNSVLSMNIHNEIRYVSKNKTLRTIFHFINTNMIVNEVDVAAHVSCNRWNKFEFTGVKLNVNTKSVDSEVFFSENLLHFDQSASVGYNIFETGIGSLLCDKSMSGLLTWFSNSIKNRASMDSFYSPTYSESYYAQSGVFRKLKEIIDFEKEKVLDACAGRGDGHLALKYQGINHTSVTRGDPYDLINNITGIIIDNNINVFDWETLTRYMDHTLFYFDLSFIKDTDNREGIFPIIYNLLNNKKKILMRINWLHGLDKTINEFNYKQKCLALLPIVGSFTSDHIYIYISKLDDITTDSDLLRTSVTYSTLMMKSLDPFSITLSTETELESDHDPKPILLASTEHIDQSVFISDVEKLVGQSVINREVENVNEELLMEAVLSLEHDNYYLQRYLPCLCLLNNQKTVSYSSDLCCIVPTELFGMNKKTIKYIKIGDLDELVDIIALSKTLRKKKALIPISNYLKYWVTYLAYINYKDKSSSLCMIDINEDVKKVNIKITSPGDNQIKKRYLLRQHILYSVMNELPVRESYIEAQHYCRINNIGLLEYKALFRQYKLYTVHYSESNKFNEMKETIIRKNKIPFPKYLNKRTDTVRKSKMKDKNIILEEQSLSLNEIPNNLLDDHTMKFIMNMAENMFSTNTFGSRRLIQASDLELGKLPQKITEIEENSRKQMNQILSDNSESEKLRLLNEKNADNLMLTNIIAIDPSTLFENRPDLLDYRDEEEEYVEEYGEGEEERYLLPMELEEELAYVRSELVEANTSEEEIGRILDTLRANNEKLKKDWADM